MRLLHRPSLATDLSSSFILLDSTALIDASQSDDFLQLLTNIVGSGCSFITIPSVVYEYTRSSISIEQFEKQLEFLKELRVTVINKIEEIIQSEQVFLVAYNKAFGTRKERGPSYTDSLLCALAYKYRNSSLKIMSANHKDIPMSIFERQDLITIDVGGELRTEGIYEFSESRFGKVLGKLEKA